MPLAEGPLDVGDHRGGHPGVQEGVHPPFDSRRSRKVAEVAEVVQSVGLKGADVGVLLVHTMKSAIMPIESET